MNARGCVQNCGGLGDVSAAETLAQDPEWLCLKCGCDVRGPDEYGWYYYQWKGQRYCLECAIRMKQENGDL